MKFNLTRKTGIVLMLIGLAMQFLNIITYIYWEIDIDIPGALIFVIGLIIMVVRWKKH
ncbi:hypothetical protein J4402_04525 [Candidatus Pacearchaeota archaeon]|nr:hypothetical protein [Candidatus Pacearchaeota archaeon]